MSKPRVLELALVSPFLPMRLRPSSITGPCGDNPIMKVSLLKMGLLSGPCCLCGLPVVCDRRDKPREAPKPGNRRCVQRGDEQCGHTLFDMQRGVLNRKLTNAGVVHAGRRNTPSLSLVPSLVESLKPIVSSVMGDDDGFGVTRQLCNKHVGIVGLGRIGAATARRMECFGCTIGYWSRSAKPQYPNYVYYDNVVHLARHCDILIVACSSSEETKNIINGEVLHALGPLGFVVNVSRGPVIDEAQLVSALKEGRIAGAGLDVFENDSHLPDELMNLDTCVLQPHAASNTMETQQAMANMVVANLEAQFAGKPPLTPVC